MASVNDVGVSGQPLNTPPLTEWQKAVRDALNSSDVTVDARIAAATAPPTWQPYTPTVAGATYQSLTARYVAIGKTVIVRIAGTVSTVTGDISFTLPLPPFGTGMAMGTAVFYGVASYFAHAYYAAGKVIVRCPGTNGANVVVSPTVPFTWAAGHSISVVLTYETT